MRDKVNFGAEQGYAPSDVGAGESGVGKSHLNKVHLVKIMRMLNTLGQECMTATTDGDTSTWHDRPKIWTCSKVVTQFILCHPATLLRW